MSYAHTQWVLKPRPYHPPRIIQGGDAYWARAHWLVSVVGWGSSCLGSQMDNERSYLFGIITSLFIPFLSRGANYVGWLIFHFWCSLFSLYYESYSSVLIWCPIILWAIQGLQDKIKLVPIDLQNRPAWYKEKVYSANKVKPYRCNIFFTYLDVTWKYIVPFVCSSN